MTKRKSTIQSIKQEVEGTSNGNGKGKLSWFEKQGVEKELVLGHTAQLFCDGHSLAQIAEKLGERFDITVSREMPYKLLAYSAFMKRFEYWAPTHVDLEKRAQDKYPWLDEVTVVHTLETRQVAIHGAEKLLRLVKQAAYEHDEVHVGISGGIAMRHLIQYFSLLLREEQEDLPKTIVFHSMVSGVDNSDSTTDPNTFWSCFLDEAGISVDLEIVALRTPAMVRGKDLVSLKDLDAIKESYSRRKELHIIVTSASQWNDGDSMLRTYMDPKKATMKKLEAAGVVGDVLWRPVSEKGPIEIEEDEDYRAMTLMELSHFKKFIKDGGKVLLVLGPCGGCNMPKTDILRAALLQKRSLLTHLVVDYPSLAPLVGGYARTKAPPAKRG